MKFGKVDSVKNIDFSLPENHMETQAVIEAAKYSGKPNIYVGCAKWNRQDLKNFYPRGTKDELAYYSSQFNCIEMNASFYRIFSGEQFTKWADKVPDEFRFFPKVFQGVSHWQRLKETERYVTENVHAIGHLGDKLEMAFLQMHENFKATEENLVRVYDFMEQWPSHIPLAFELRHTDWYNDNTFANRLYEILEKNKIANVITDTAGRRDLLHMRLTTNHAFIRYVGANDPSDYDRVEEWATRLKQWTDFGLENIYFFVHQNDEQESVNISRHFIKELQKHGLGEELKLPNLLNTGAQGSLF